MHKNYQSILPPVHDSKSAWPRNRPSGNPGLRRAVAAIGLLVFAVAAYSSYVALHVPDPQETVLLGQAKMAAGSPAGLRILVRNRVSGKPVRGAKVTLALHNKTNDLKLGTFRTDSAGSIGDSLTLPNIAPGE